MAALSVPTIRQTFFILLPIFVFVFITSLLSFYELWSEETHPLSTLRTNVAVIYAGPTFHEEVVSAFACMLKDLNYYTVVYIGSGVHVNGMLVPFSNRRKRGSMTFYGHCVNQWVTITDPLTRYPHDPDLLIFITYPMHTKGFVKDARAFDLLKHHHDTHASSSVILVTHRVSELLHALLPEIQSFVSDHQLYFCFLGEHTMNAALRLVESKGYGGRVVGIGMGGSGSGVGNSSKGMMQLTYLYPIIPLYYIAELSPASVPPFTRALALLLDPLLSLITRTFTPAIEAAASTHTHTRDPDTLVFGIQGNLGGKHAHRKNVQGTVECFNKFLGERGTNADSAYLRSTGMGNASAPPKIGLDLVGHISLPFVTGSLQGGDINFYNDLSSPEYYKQIARLTFMLPALLDAEYTTSRATSSVPAALLTGTPLITSKSFLSIYPCLRTAAIHSKIAQGSECESAKLASQLTKSEIALMRKEARACGDEWYREGLAVLHSLAVAASDRRASVRSVRV